MPSRSGLPQRTHRPVPLDVTRPGGDIPESKKRKRRVYTAPLAPGAIAKKRRPSPVWLAPLMLVLFGVGIAWLVVFYLTNGGMLGIPGVNALGNANLLVGFAFIIGGFGMSTQWR